MSNYEVDKDVTKCKYYEKTREIEKVEEVICILEEMVKQSGRPLYRDGEPIELLIIKADKLIMYYRERHIDEFVKKYSQHTFKTAKQTILEHKQDVRLYDLDVDFVCEEDNIRYYHNFLSSHNVVEVRDKKITTNKDNLRDDSSRLQATIYYKPKICSDREGVYDRNLVYLVDKILKGRNLL